MLRTLVALQIALLTLSCANSNPRAGNAHDPAGDDRAVIPGERFGAVDRSTGESDLQAIYGFDQVSSEPFYMAEGFCAPGTVVLPDSPDRLEIAWIDSLRTHPAIVRAREHGASWRTPRGVGIGTTLDELERIAGGPVSFGGFGWDYGGGMSWDDGTSDASGPFGLRVGPDADGYDAVREDPRFEEILGERTVGSDHPIFDTLTVRVEEMTMYWEQPFGERECETLQGGSAESG